MTCTPQELAAAAACYRCLPDGMIRSIRTSLICQWANSECTDPIVDDWLARIDAGGFNRPWRYQIQAVCEFCHALRAAGIVDSFLGINVVVNTGLADRIETMSYPLINVGGNSPWVNHGFLATHLNDNGIAKDPINPLYFDTGIRPSDRLNDSTGGLTILETNESTQHVLLEAELGCSGLDIPSGRISNFWIEGYDPAVFGPLGQNWDDLTSVSAATGDRRGFYSQSRTATNALTLYSAPPFALENFNNADQTGAYQTCAPIYFMAINDTQNDPGFDCNVPTPARWTLKRIAFAAIHYGLTQTQTEALWNAVLAMRLAFAAGVSDSIILPDGTGSFWKVVVDSSGLLGTQPDPGPATADVILDDGVGGLWQLVAAPGGLLGTNPVLTPATAAPQIAAPDAILWTIIVDAMGNLGATS